MSKAIQLIAVLAAGRVGTAACTSPPSPLAHAAPTTSTPVCIGLSSCPAAPPDAEGNPACYYSDGWRANSAGAGIEVASAVQEVLLTTSAGRCFVVGGP